MGPDTKQINRVMAFAGFLLLTLAVVIIVYYAIAVPTEGSFGERYVTTVISPPYPLNQITTFKPVTLMTYFVFCGTVFVLEANKDRLSRVRYARRKGHTLNSLFRCRIRIPLEHVRLVHHLA